MDNMSIEFDPETVDYALWGVNGGGLARWSAEEDAYVWVELPRWMLENPQRFQQERVGDPIGKSDVIPANELAREEMSGH